MQDKKILVVDDSALMRKVLRDIFEEGGFTNVSEAANGQEALEICESNCPDIMFLDIVMPEISGIDVLKKVGDKVKTVVVSSVGQQSVIEEAKKCGALDFIVKPFEKDHVLDRAKKFLK